MKKIVLLYSLGLLFCCNNKNQNIETINTVKKKVVDIHLSRSIGMVDMTKNIKTTYYSIRKDKIYIINELNNPLGDVLQRDTVQILNKDNSKIFNDFNNNPNLKPFFSEGLQDDSGGWSYTLYYTDASEKQFVFTSKDTIPNYAKALYDLFNFIEVN